nr:hypothetical protein [Tanacetum cinerariifolium]
MLHTRSISAAYSRLQQRCTSLPNISRPYIDGIFILGIAIAVMLRNKIGFPDERHRGRYAVYAFYALAIAIMMVVVVLSSG